MINLELYRIFKIVADEENLTKASEILHISQPAVTKHIKNLEKELNVKLFKRSKYGMILNENGKKLYLQIKDSIEILSKTDSIFNTHKDIKLGVHVNMPDRIYNNGISNFYEKNNNNIINIHRLNAKNMFLALEKQEIDLAFSKKYSDELYDINKIKFIKIGDKRGLQPEGLHPSRGVAASGLRPLCNILEQICSEGAPETVKSTMLGQNSCTLHVFGDNCTSGSTFQSTDSADVTEENLR